MGKTNNWLLDFLAYLLTEKSVENAGNGISETLNLNIFCGSIPPNPSRLSRLRMGATTFLPRVHTPSKPQATPLHLTIFPVDDLWRIMKRNKFWDIVAPICSPQVLQEAKWISSFNVYKVNLI